MKYYIWLSRVTICLLCSLIVVLGVVLLVQPNQLLVVQYSIPPFAILFFSHIGLFVLATWFLEKLNLSKRQWYLALLVFGLIAFVFYVRIGVPLLGDADTWTALASTKEIYTSNILASFFYHVAYLWHFDLRYLPPILGAISVVIGMVVAKGLKITPARFLFWWMASSIGAIFFWNYIETVIWGIPWLLLYIRYIVLYLESENSAERYLPYAGLMLTLAALSHGMAVFLLPSLPLATVIKLTQGKASHWFRHFFVLGLTLVIMLLLTIIVIKAFTFMDYNLINADVNGGPDGQFVPWQPTNSGYFRFTMLSWSHITEISNLMLLMLPASFGVAITILIALGRKKIAQLNSVSVWLSVLVLGVFGFISLWGFDKGYPMDWDLMTGFGCILVFWVGYIFQHYIHQTWLERVLWVLSFFYVWYIIMHIVLLM